MRLLRVLSSLNPACGGVAEAVRSTTRVLLQENIDVEIACMDAPKSPWLKDLNKVHAFGPGHIGWSYATGFKKWLTRKLSAYDVVIIEGIWQYPSWITAKLSSQKKIPYLVMPHGHLDPWFQQLSHRPFKSIRNIIYWRFFEQAVVNNASSLLFTCEEEMLSARKPFRPYSPKRESVVGLGICEAPNSTSSIRRSFSKKSGILDGRPYFLFLSRIDPKKGVDLLIKAYAKVCRNQRYIRNIPALVIAGPGIESPFGRKCIKLCHANYLKVYIAGKPMIEDAQIIFTGMLSGEAKWGAIYGSEAFVLPSHQENFGIAVVEALACGKPVLISNKINIWQEIGHSGAGIVSDDTLQGTIEVLDSWLRMDKHEQAEMIDKTKKCFEDNFEIKVAAHRLIKELRRSLAQ